MGAFRLSVLRRKLDAMRSKEDMDTQAEQPDEA